MTYLGKPHAARGLIPANPDIGVFTPTLIGLTTAGTNLYTTQSGWYSRKGDELTFAVEIKLSGASGAFDSTGDAVIAGVPYVAATRRNTALNVGYYEGVNVATRHVMKANAEEDTGRILLYRCTHTGCGTLKQTEVNDSFQLSVSGTILLT